jgi:hypothetical protein
VGRFPAEAVCETPADLEPLVPAALWGFWLTAGFAAGAGLVEFELEVAPAGACAADAATHASTSALAAPNRKARVPAQTRSVNANFSLDKTSAPALRKKKRPDRTLAL